MEAAHILFETVISVLGGSTRSKVWRGANFYDLGGNSLNSVFTVTKLRQQGYVIGQSRSPGYTAVNMIITDEVVNLHYLSLAGITSFISSKDLQEVIDQMHRTSDSDTAAAIEKQQDMGYVAHMLQDEHKDAVNQSVHFT
jgi:transcription antitermination factor NusG